MVCVDNFTSPSSHMDGDTCLDYEEYHDKDIGTKVLSCDEVESSHTAATSTPTTPREVDDDDQDHNNEILSTSSLSTVPSLSSLVSRNVSPKVTPKKRLSLESFLAESFISVSSSKHSVGKRTSYATELQLQPGASSFLLTLKYQHKCDFGDDVIGSTTVLTGGIIGTHSAANDDNVEGEGGMLSIQLLSNSGRQEISTSGVTQVVVLDAKAITQFQLSLTIEEDTDHAAKITHKDDQDATKTLVKIAGFNQNWKFPSTLYF